MITNLPRTNAVSTSSRNFCNLLYDNKGIRKFVYAWIYNFNMPTSTMRNIVFITIFFLQNFGSHELPLMVMHTSPSIYLSTNIENLVIYLHSLEKPWQCQQIDAKEMQRVVMYTWTQFCKHAVIDLSFQKLSSMHLNSMSWKLQSILKLLFLKIAKHALICFIHCDILIPQHS